MPIFHTKLNLFLPKSCFYTIQYQNTNTPFKCFKLCEHFYIGLLYRMCLIGLESDIFDIENIFIEADHLGQTLKVPQCSPSLQRYNVKQK